jgi:hypothetical protein
MSIPAIFDAIQLKKLIFPVTDFTRPNHYHIEASWQSKRDVNQFNGEIQYSNAKFVREMLYTIKTALQDYTFSKTILFCALGLVVVIVAFTCRTGQ